MFNLCTNFHTILCNSINFERGGGAKLRLEPDAQDDYNIPPKLRLLGYKKL